MKTNLAAAAVLAALLALASEAPRHAGASEAPLPAGATAPVTAGDPTPVAAQAQAQAWRRWHEREVIQELSDLLAIPNLASDTLNIERNAAAIRAMLASRGLEVRLLTLPGAPPIVVGELRPPGSVPAVSGSSAAAAVGAVRTIAFYAHYDGQPVDPAAWQSPPWTPVMRDGNGRDVDWRGAASIDPEWRL
jgi:transposase